MPSLRRRGRFGPDLVELRSLDALVIAAGAIGRLGPDEVVAHVAARLSRQPASDWTP